MCGICGIINFCNKTVEIKQIHAMMKAIKYRGPDDEGSFVSNNIGLGHVRLSIIDLSEQGRQPFFSNDKRYIIVFNGEIYNYIELKEDLIQNGMIFRTKTDTEVLLNAYIFYGELFLEKLNGMFAFAIYDKINKTVFIARDRFGIKPLYYYSDKNLFIFASDIPAILEVLPNKRESDFQTIYDFFYFNRTNHNEKTFFKNIFKLQHGSFIHIDSKSFQIKKWYSLKHAISKGVTNTQDFLECFLNSIKLQLRSDVPLGVCLSGGLDSSSIVSVVQKYFQNQELNTFSAIYKKGDKGDETEFINEFKPFIQNMHFVEPNADTLLSDLDSFVKALVEPVTGTSEYAEYKIMELAKKNVTVLLNGQGADEMMAGYLYFAGFYYKELLSHFKFKKLINEIYYDIKNHKSFEGLQGFMYFSLPNSLKNKFTVNNTSYLNDEFKSTYNGSDEIIKTLYSSKTLKESFINHFEHKFEHHLIWADRSAMWFSIESRFPFLDHHLVEKTLSMNNDQYINKGWNKYILRESMKNILPEKIRLRKDKVGYETPEDKWFRETKMQEYIFDIIHSSTFNTSIFNRELSKKAYTDHINKKLNISGDIWKWINFYLWEKQNF